MRPLIGLFDSGLGSLSVARAILRYSPACDLWIVGDTAHVPYGGRPLEEVRGFALGLTEYLLKGGCAAVVMACNISSAVGLEEARKKHPAASIFGMIEAGALAVGRHTDPEPVGVLATEGTVASGAYVRALTAKRNVKRVVQSACPGFVPLVESGEWNSAEALGLAREYVAPLVTAQCRKVILGCTHYPFLESAIRAAFPYEVTLIDPALKVAEQLKSVILSSGEFLTDGDLRCEATADPEAFSHTGAVLLGHTFTATLCPVWN